MSQQGKRKANKSFE